MIFPLVKNSQCRPSLQMSSVPPDGQTISRRRTTFPHALWEMRKMAKVLETGGEGLFSPAEVPPKPRCFAARKCSRRSRTMQLLADGCWLLDLAESSGRGGREQWLLAAGCGREQLLLAAGCWMWPRAVADGCWLLDVAESSG